MFGHCAHSRYAWNLALEVNATYREGGARREKPVRYAGMCRMLSEVRRTDTTGMDPGTVAEFAWAASGNADVQQQALKDFDHALSNFLGRSHGYPTWRKKYRQEGPG